MTEKKILIALIAVMIVATSFSCSKSNVVNNSNKDSSSTDNQDKTDGENIDIISELGLTDEIKEATTHTVKVNSAIYSVLDFTDTQEADFAARGLIDAPEKLEIKDENGKVIWSQAAYSFLSDYEKAPDSVNRSLWENTKNNHLYGLFEVTKGIYQVLQDNGARFFDLCIEKKDGE